MTHSCATCPSRAVLWDYLAALLVGIVLAAMLVYGWSDARGDVPAPTVAEASK